MVDSMVELTGKRGTERAVRRIAALFACLAEGQSSSAALDPLHLDAHAAELDENGEQIRVAKGRWPADYRQQAKQLLAVIGAPASGPAEVARMRREWAGPIVPAVAPVDSGSGALSRRCGRSPGSPLRAR